MRELIELERKVDYLPETADERTDVSGRTWYTTYTSLGLLFFQDNRRIVLQW